MGLGSATIYCHRTPLGSKEKSRELWGLIQSLLGKWPGSSSSPSLCTHHTTILGDSTLRIRDNSRGLYLLWALVLAGFCSHTSNYDWVTEEMGPHVQTTSWLCKLAFGHHQGSQCIPEVHPSDRCQGILVLPLVGDGYQITFWKVAMQCGGWKK